MRQYTTPEQTAKLIELGLEKPKGWCAEGISSHLHMYKRREDEEGFNYSIGELIEMLPKSLENPYNPPLAIEYNEKWRVYYGVQEDYSWEYSIWYEEEGRELIDALYYMAVKLKAKGVI